jgi:hypothetical protein
MEAAWGRRVIRRLSLFVVVLLAFSIPHPARAAEATTERFVELVRQASNDPSALEELKRIDSVDGRDLDVALALEGATGSELDQRLSTLADSVSTRTGDAVAAREAAARILAASRFQPARFPRPFKSVLEWLGDKTRPVLAPIGKRVGGAIDWIVRIIPGPAWVGWVAFASAVLLAGAVGALLLTRRRTRAIEAAAHHVRHDRRGNPRVLEEAADEAERSGDLDAALRLRFRAGLLRLDRASVIELRESLTTRQVSRLLKSHTFDQLAGAFEVVAYGGRPATESDLDTARTQWTRVLEEVA